MVTSLPSRCSACCGGEKQHSARDYFLGKDKIPWWVVCFSIVAAEISTLTFISIPGLAYLTNLGFLQVTIGYLLGRIAVSFLFLPSYYKGELVTAYGFLENRFGSKTRSLASMVFLFTRIAAGRKALIWSGIIIIAQFTLFLLVGLLLYGHYSGATVAELGLRRADEIFPRFIIEGLPPGVSGFIIVGLFSALGRRKR